MTTKWGHTNIKLCVISTENIDVIEAHPLSSEAYVDVEEWWPKNGALRSPRFVIYF